MSDIAIQIESLGKQYRIGGKKEMYKTLRETCTDAFVAPFRCAGKLLRGQSTGATEVDKRIWALKDVSFEVKRGEVLGIIGHNGAGKSTLLKILCRITEPTEGQAEIFGRVGSLLEVGTGFHPELTGRENIYLNGAILGMKKVEIERKFDEIVTFAEVEKFIDTPVKHYSSGMYLRLAFAVAAHLEPEILLVDEVLAVGDAAFQKKCLGRMEDVAKEGRTVLFVSHNMGAIIQLCPSSIVLRQGKIAAKGPSRETVEWYLADLSSSANSLELKNSVERNGDGRLQFVAAYLQDETGERNSIPIAGRPLKIVLEFVSRENLAHVRFMLTIYNQIGIAVTHCNVDAYGQRFRVQQGKGVVTCHIPKLPLPPGHYRIAVAASDDMDALDWISSACIFDVEASDFFHSPYVPPLQYSTALVEHSWQLKS